MVSSVDHDDSDGGLVLETQTQKPWYAFLFTVCFSRYKPIQFVASNAPPLFLFKLLISSRAENYMHSPSSFLRVPMFHGYILLIIFLNEYSDDVCKFSDKNQVRPSPGIFQSYSIASTVCVAYGGGSHFMASLVPRNPLVNGTRIRGFGGLFVSYIGPQGGYLEDGRCTF